MKYRKKPVVIEANQWFKNGDHPRDNPGNEVMSDGTLPEGEIVRYFRRPDVPADKICDKCGHFMEKHGWIDTLEGGHIVCPGDWIIRGIQGELYPCKPDIFEATYGPENDTFTGWNKFPDVKPSYDFDAIVEFEDGGMWIAAWKDDHWDFSAPHMFDLGIPVKKWMAFPE